MRDSELRGLILEALYNQRRKDLVNLDDELGGPPLPHGATESILRQLVKKGLIERPIQPLNGLGNARITACGIDVVQGTTGPPLSILLHQRITVQDVQVGEGNIQNFSDTKLESAICTPESCFVTTVGMTSYRDTVPIGCSIVVAPTFHWLRRRCTAHRP